MFAAQLYEQILAENEKLKAQLRDTDLELADLKLQLEKATQVRAARRAGAAAVLEEVPDLCPLLSFQRQERYADRSQLEMEKRVKRVGSPQSSCTGTCVTCVCVCMMVHPYLSVTPPLGLCLKVTSRPQYPLGGGMI